MSIEVQCDACYYSFSVKDEHAGKKGKCPECGSVVAVPGASGRASSRSPASSQALPRKSRPAASTSSRSSSGGSNTGLIVGIGGGIAVLLIVLIGLVAFRSGGGAPNNVATNNQTPETALTANAASPSTPQAPGTPQPSSDTSASPPASAGAAASSSIPATAARTTPASTTAPPDATSTESATTPPGSGGSAASSAATDTSRPYASIADLIEAVEPSACRINVKLSEGASTGSGFVVDKDGTVVTNYHVIEGGSEATVIFPDKSTAKVLGFLVLEPKHDLAILKIEYPADKLHPARLATEDPRKGEEVVAIGAPLGLDFTATEGKISAVRTADELKRYGADVEGSWIQSSTPISPGNSGGPLFNMKGEIVAANTMSISGQGAQNLNFGSSHANIRATLQKKSDKLIAMKPENAPQVAARRPGGGGRETIVDETKSERGKKLLANVKQVLLQEVNISFDRTGEVTAYVRNMAEKSWKQAGVDVSNDPRAPAFMLIVMQFKKGTGRASNSILEISAVLFVRDDSGPRPQVVRVWSDQEEVGTISENALAVGNIPEAMRKKVLSFFGQLRTAHKAAGNEARKDEKK